MSTLLAGDWHSNTVAMRRALSVAEREGHDEVIQLGDFGVGWRFVEEQCKFLQQAAAAVDVYGIPLSFLPGNHENYDYLEAIGAHGATEPREVAPGVTYLPRGAVIERGLNPYTGEPRRILCVGGAYSVDKARRTPHTSWWPQEELTYEEVTRCIELDRCDVVLSHDAPNRAFQHALAWAAGDPDAAPERLAHLLYKNDESFPDAKHNRYALQAIFDHHHPDLWVHGHYHFAYEAELITSCQPTTHVIGLSLECEPGALTVLA